MKKFVLFFLLQLGGFLSLIIFQGGPLILASGCAGEIASTDDGVDDGDISGDAEGLAIAEQLSLVTASEEEEAPSLIKALNALKFSAPTTGDYVTDEGTVVVFDRSMEALDLINEIFCFFDQTAYDGMVNQGNYTALVDPSLCERSDNREDENNDESSSEETSFETWTINSTRENNESPQIVQVWIPPTNDTEDMAEEIRVLLVITEGVSDTNPYGVFMMNFVGLIDNVPTFTGYLSSSNTVAGLVELQMLIEGGDTMHEETHALLDSTGITGNAYVSRSFSDSMEGEHFEETFNISFDDSHYLTETPDETTCLSRNEFTNFTHEYNLYGTDGSRTERNSGMGIRYGEFWGWAGYHGIWLPEDIVTIENGMEVTNNDQTETYTIQVGEGRLIRRTKNLLTMNDFIGDTLNYWSDIDQTTLQVSWDGTSLTITGEEICAENGCSVTDTEDESFPLEPNQWIGFWKPGMGSLDLLTDENATVSGTTEVNYYTEEFVLPDDPIFASGSVTFKCHFNCPTAPITDSNDPFLQASMEVSDDSPPILYSFDPETYILTNVDDGLNATWEVENSEGTAFAWGFRSGAMVLEDVALESPWVIWNQDTTYMYETGPHAWNKHMALRDSDGNTLVFEPPLGCLLQKENVGTFFLDYNGPGKLFGIPYSEMEDNDDEWERWVPDFNIDDGTELNCDGDSYYTKAMFTEQMMVENPDGCTDLSVSDIGPTTLTFVDPGMGEAPEVTDPPAVIGGVVVE